MRPPLFSRVSFLACVLCVTLVVSPVCGLITGLRGSTGTIISRQQTNSPYGLVGHPLMCFDGAGNMFLKDTSTQSKLYRMPNVGGGQSTTADTCPTSVYPPTSDTGTAYTLYSHGCALAADSLLIDIYNSSNVAGTSNSIVGQMSGYTSEITNKSKSAH